MCLDDRLIGMQRRGHSPLMPLRSAFSSEASPKLAKGMRGRTWSRSLNDLYEPQFHLKPFENGAKRPSQKFEYDTFECFFFFVYLFIV